MQTGSLDTAAAGAVSGSSAVPSDAPQPFPSLLLLDGREEFPVQGAHGLCWMSSPEVSTLVGCSCPPLPSWELLHAQPSHPQAPFWAAAAPRAMGAPSRSLCCLLLMAFCLKIIIPAVFLWSDRPMGLVPSFPRCLRSPSVMRQLVPGICHGYPCNWPSCRNAGQGWE